MRKHLLKVISMLLAVTLLSVYLPVFAQVSEAVTQSYEKVEVWKRTDIILNSDITYTNPYKDVEIDAVFTHEDGTEIALYGFWNGGSEWRVRFSPTKEGVWSYKITCSNTADTGLHNKTGKLLAVANTGSTALDQHGFVKISDNGRYFTYDDGTPFYWLGDTNWQAPNYVSITQCNYPGCLCGNQFLHELNDRLEKGFTVYQTYFDSGESDGGGQLATTSEPSIWTDKYDTINPDTFTDKIDVMFDMLADNGMVIALGLGVHSQTTNAMGEENLNCISRYLTARYAAYPVVWITAQEAAGEPQFSLWNSSAKIVDEGDGYNHPQSAHQYSMDASNAYIEALDGEEWHDFYALQAGHELTFPSKALYESYWNNERLTSPKPYIETEASYEDITCGNFNGYENSRIAAWRANLLGSYGFTYGATGVWANNYSTAGNTGWYPSYSYEPWYMGIDKPGSYEMTYLRRFFEYADFSTLIPRFNDEAYSSFLSEDKLVSSSDDGKTYVAYFCNPTLSTGELRGLNENDTYSAKWYNPLTGNFIDISTSITVTNGIYTIPAKPTTGDWALIVTSRTNLGSYTTETVYTDDLIETRIDYALDAIVTESSANGTDHGGKAAADNSLNTYWCAANGDMPQWIIMDFGTALSFAELDFYFYRGTSNVTFTVEGSSDGVDYEPFYTVTKENTAKYNDIDFFRITKEGSYRFLKFSFSEILTNWAALYEIGVYTIAAESESIVENTNILASSTITTSGDGATTNPPSCSIDGDVTNYWVGNGSTNQWISYDMGSVKEFNSVAFAMVGGTTAITYTIEGSLDGKVWDTLSAGTDTPPVGFWSNAPLFQFSFDKTVSYQYLRITFHSVTGNWATVSEIEAGMNINKIEEVKNIFVGSTAESSSYLADNYKAMMAYDGSLSAFWCATSSSGEWISFAFNEEKTFNSLYLVANGATAFTEIKIEISDDNAVWTTIYDNTTVRATEQVEGANAYAITLDKAYTTSYMKLTFEATAAGWISVAEIEGTLSEKEVVIEEGNLLTGSTATSSAANSTSPASSAIDGDTSSWWCGDGSTNQWIAFNMGAVKGFNKLSMTVYGGTTALDLVIETSQNGTDWTPFYTNAALTPVGKVNNSELFSVTFDEMGTSQYLRIYFNNVTGNWATIVEAELTYETPNEDDTLPTYEGTLQTPGVSGTGSYIYSADGLGSDTNAALTDGDVTTEWVPFAPIGSQTLIFDLYEAKTLYGINITLGEYAYLPDYRIMASADGESWTILVDDTLRDPITYTVGGRTVLSEALSGSYRYIKLLWLNAGGNGDTKTLAEVEIFAEGTTPTAPTAPDVTELLALYNELKNLSNSQKTYSAVSFRALSKAIFAAGVLLGDTKYASAEDVTLAQNALASAYEALVERLGSSGKDIDAYISLRKNSTSHDIRFVLSAKTSAIDAYESLTVTVAFETESGTVTKSYTLDSNGTKDFGVFLTVTGGGKTYEATAGNALFGLVIKEIPENAWNSVTLTVSNGNTTVYQGSCSYEQLFA